MNQPPPPVKNQAPRRYRLLLLAFLLWPLLHWGLVRWGHIEAWKFGGWAMYSVPQRQVQVSTTIYPESTTRPTAPNFVQQRQIAEFRKWRQRTGRFAATSDLAADLRASAAGPVSVTIDLTEPVYQAESNRYLWTQRRYRYPQRAQRAQR